MRSTKAPHVAIIISNYWPEPTGGSPPATEFATFLADAGLKVTVVTSVPYYPQWRIYDGYRKRVWLTESHAGVTIYRSWHFVSQKVSTAARILHELTLAVFALPNMFRAIRGAGIVYVISPELSFAWLGSVVARLLRVPRTAIVFDVMPDAAIELGMLTNPVMIRIARWMASSIYDSAEQVNTLGEGMRTRIARLARNTERLAIMPLTVDGAELYPVADGDNEFRKRFVPPGTFAVLHAGNMGKKQDLNLILRAATLMRGEPAFHFYVFGDGAVKTEFLAEKERLRLDNISHHALQERWLLKHMLSGADVVLISQLKSVVDIVVPSKMLTALVSGACIVAACSPGSAPADMIEASGGGHVVPAEDEHSLVETLRRIARGEMDTSAMRRRAREYAIRTFDRQNVYGPIAANLLTRLS